MAKLCSVMQWTLSVIVSDINFGTIQQKELNSCNRTLTYEYIYTVFRKKWYTLFLNITSQLQARFSYNFFTIFCRNSGKMTGINLL